MNDSAWSTSVSNQLTVLDDNLFALHFSDANSTTTSAIVGISDAQKGWLLVQIRGRFTLMVMLLLLLMAKILIVVAVDVVMRGIEGATRAVVVAVLVVSTDVVLILIVAVVVIVLVVWWRCSGSTGKAGRRRRCWWRYKYIVLIFRKIQIVIYVVILATVVLLEHAVGVLDTWRVSWLLVGCGVVVILILFQIVDEGAPFGVGGSTTAASATAAAAGVIFEYPNRTGMVVQQLFLVIKGFRCRPWLLLTGVVVVVTAGGMGMGVLGILSGMFPLFAGPWLEISLRHGIVMGIYRLQRMRLLLVVVAV